MQEGTEETVILGNQILQLVFPENEKVVKRKKTRKPTWNGQFHMSEIR